MRKRNDITKRKAEVLAIITERREVRRRDIAAALGISPNTVGVYLDELRMLGHVVAVSTGWCGAWRLRRACDPPVACREDMDGENDFRHRWLAAGAWRSVKPRGPASVWELAR